MHHGPAVLVFPDEHGVQEHQAAAAGEPAGCGKELLGPKGVVERDPNQDLRDEVRLRFVVGHATWSHGAVLGARRGPVVVGGGWRRIGNGKRYRERDESGVGQSWSASALWECGTLPDLRLGRT